MRICAISWRGHLLVGVVKNLRAHKRTHIFSPTPTQPPPIPKSCLRPWGVLREQSVPPPLPAAAYNKYMGAVDLTDQPVCKTLWFR